MPRYAAAVSELVVHRRGRGRPLLFLHGATLDHRMWEPQQQLADRFEVITYDLRGFGRSPPPTEPFKHCADAAALIDELGLRDVLVIGHSIGALYGLELALLRPDAVTGFVSLCMSGLVQDYPSDVVAMFAELERLARSDRLADAKALWSRCGWFTSARAIPDVATLLDRYLADYSGWYWLHDTPATNLEPPARMRLAELAIPTLVVDGTLDLPYNHAIADQLVAEIKHARLLRLPDIGHMANLEAPATITAAIADAASR
jgi:3-oxoadipate enol-lactonase